MHDIDDDCDYVPMKRIRSTCKNKEFEGEWSNSQPKKTQEMEENQPKKRQPWRKITMDDMFIGEGVNCPTESRKRSLMNLESPFYSFFNFLQQYKRIGDI